ncbi:MAG: hypothetical protein Q4C30_10020 [Bacteroidia bacterium]|nr:hypothetical protein [Bacteroidia bacterium]
MNKLFNRCAIVIASLISMSLTFVSCDEVPEGNTPISLVGLWKVDYAYTEEGNNVVGGASNNYMYFQVNKDKTYTSCLVKYDDNDTPTILVEKGKWKRNSLDLTLTPSDANGTVYKIKLNTVVSVDGTVSVESPTKTSTLTFNAITIYPSWEKWREEVIDAAKPYVTIPAEVRYSSRLFTSKMQASSGFWFLKKDGTLDCYVHTWCKWKETNGDKEVYKPIVQHCHGKIEIHEHAMGCDSIDIIIDDYQVPTADISTEYVMSSLLLPGAHRYPISYKSDHAIINRSKDNLPQLELSYKANPFNLKDCHIVPWDFDLSEYKITYTNE